MTVEMMYPSVKVLGQTVSLCTREFMCEDHCGRNRTEARACFCDDVCLQMGDCCIDYEHRCINQEKIPSWDEACIYKVLQNGTLIPPLLDGMFDNHIIGKYEEFGFIFKYHLFSVIYRPNRD